MKNRKIGTDGIECVRWTSKICLNSVNRPSERGERGNI